jgi:hypothetical protein
MEDPTETTEAPKSQEVKLPKIFEIKRKHREMAELPYLKTFDVTGNYDGEEPKQERVLTSQIIASPRLENWADEYHGDWAAEGLSSVEKMSQEIQKDPDEFWENNQHAVKLTKIDGPKGPIYAVEDGSHRVAAAKFAEALEIPAEVSDLTNRREYATTKETDVLWWQALIASGAIKGQINQSNHESTLTLDETPELPWIIRPRSDFIKVNRIYQEIYGDKAFDDTQTLPDSLKDKLLDSGQLMVWENTVLRDSNEAQSSQ